MFAVAPLGHTCTRFASIIMSVQLAAFDIDGTLAESKQKIALSMASALADLLHKIPIAIISGGSFDLLCEQIVSQLPVGTNFANLYLFPTTGAACFVFDGTAWHPAYQMLLSEEECSHVIETIKTVVNGSKFAEGEPCGPRIEYRGSSVIYSALGQKAPLDIKLAWDPDLIKRKELQALLAPLLSQFEVGIGGSTTIDITKKGFDKAYAIRWIADKLSIAESNIWYVGDALYEGGNDAPVLATHCTTRSVNGPKEALTLIESLLVELSSQK